MPRSIPEFGPRLPEVAYRLRSGGYAVLVRSDGAIAVISTPLGLFLPGGGQLPGELPETTAVRETLEECGLIIRPIRRLGVADELVYAADEQTYYRKRGTFFLAEMISASGGGEADHTLLWLPRDKALELLTHGSHCWAVQLSPPVASR